MFVLKMICLFLGVLFTGVNIQRTLKNIDIGGINNLLWAGGVFGFIVLQWFV